MGDELLRTALQILTAYLNRTEPDPADVRFLRQTVPARQSTWEADELACFVVRNELAHRRPASSEIEIARAEWAAAVKELNELIAEVPSGIPHPDGELRVKKAGARRTAAYKKYLELLKRSSLSKAPTDG